MHSGRPYVLSLSSGHLPMIIPLYLQEVLNVKTKAVLKALLKAKPLYALLAILLTTLGVTQSEAVSGHLFELMQLLLE